MIRTVVSLEPEEKTWVDQQAAKEHVSMATIIRDAIHHYRQELETEKRPSFTELLKQTQGITEMDDGLQYQINIRNEWDK